MLWIGSNCSDLNNYLIYRDLKQEWSNLAGILCGSYILYVTGVEKSGWHLAVLSVDVTFAHHFVAPIYLPSTTTRGVLVVLATYVSKKAI